MTFLVLVKVAAWICYMGLEYWFGKTKVTEANSLLEFLMLAIQRLSSILKSK